MRFRILTSSSSLLILPKQHYELEILLVFQVHFEYVSIRFNFFFASKKVIKFYFSFSWSELKFFATFRFNFPFFRKQKNCKSFHDFYFRLTHEATIFIFAFANLTSLLPLNRSTWASPEPWGPLIIGTTIPSRTPELCCFATLPKWKAETWKSWTMRSTMPSTS